MTNFEHQFPNNATHQHLPRNFLDVATRQKLLRKLHTKTTTLYPPCKLYYRTPKIRICAYFDLIFILRNQIFGIPHVFSEYALPNFKFIYSPYVIIATVLSISGKKHEYPTSQHENFTVRSGK